MYPARSVLRFQTSHTAVVLKDNRIYQVKSPSNEKLFFDTIDQWAQTLPGTPTADVLVVSTAESEKTQKQKQKQITEKKPTKKRFHVPTKNVSQHHGALKWARHIYYSIKQLAPALLADEAIMDAYNTFINALNTDPSVYLSIPRGAHKYLRGISMEDHDTIPIQCTILNLAQKTQSELQVKKRIILAEYRVAYLPFYELIKRTIVPIIEKQTVERYIAATVAWNTKLLMNAIQKQNRVRNAFECSMKRHDSNIAYYKNSIEQQKNKKPRIFDWELPTAS